MNKYFFTRRFDVQYLPGKYDVDVDVDVAERRRRGTVPSGENHRIVPAAVQCSLSSQSR